MYLNFSGFVFHKVLISNEISNLSVLLVMELFFQSSYCRELLF